MANDVKALPVVAYGYANTRPTGERHSLMMVALDNSGDQYPELALPLVLKSDAESALAELREELERLRKENRDLMRSRLQESQIADPVHSDRALRLADDAAESVICTEGHSPAAYHWVLTHEQIAADPYLEDCIAHLEWRGIARRVDAEDGVAVILKTR